MCVCVCVCEKYEFLRFGALIFIMCLRRKKKEKKAFIGGIPIVLGTIFICTYYLNNIIKNIIIIHEERKRKKEGKCIAERGRPSVFLFNLVRN